ncbi:hypothetical protein HPP92_003912, partial [Vanilla planifolia]
VKKTEKSVEKTRKWAHRAATNGRNCTAYFLGTSLRKWAPQSAGFGHRIGYALRSEQVGPVKQDDPFPRRPNRRRQIILRFLLEAV